MTAGKESEFYELTFSQREGKAPLPEPMKLGQIPQRFRQLVWQFIDNAIDDEKVDIGVDIYNDDYFPNHGVGGIDQIILSYKFDVLGQLHNTLSSLPSKDKKLAYEMILSGEYHDVITFVEYILRREECSDRLRTLLRSAFDESSTAYRVEEIDGRPCVVPRVSRETGEATRQAIETIRDGGMDGAATHLRQAAEHINARQYADSVADSIHAVESVARVIDPKASKTLGPALDSLEKAGMLKHKALKEAFQKLYGYASDEQGIRHALLEKDAPQVGQDEAVFMFGACASFAAYLTNRHRQAGEREAGGG